MEHDKKIIDIIDYIEKHLCEKLKLNEIAKQVHFSEFHFHRLFRKAIGMPLMHYIRARRLSEAAAELVETNEDITSIAFKYQFSSEEAFSRAFRQMYRICPRDYRNTRRLECNYKKTSSFRKGTGVFSSSNTILNRAA